MTKVLLNCSTLMKGGSLQVASSVIDLAIQDDEIDWYFAFSKAMYLKFKQSLDVGFEDKVILLDQSPARSRTSRKKLEFLVEKYNFDVVFTLFGPAYVKFNVPHLCGIADGWVTHSNKQAYHSLNSLKEKIRTFLLCQYKLWWFRRADKWCVEALVAKEGFSSKTRCEPQAISVIPNAVNQMFQKYASIAIPRTLSETINIFCLGADYWHKNYQIIPEVLVRLNQYPYKINFITTMPENSPIYLSIKAKADQLNVSERLVNLGAISLDEVLNSYKKYNILFFPSLLETFSITPLEALYMNMPMVISKIPANSQVVGTHATYVDPLDAKDITAKLIDVISHYDEEVSKLHRLKQSDYFNNIPNASNRFNTYKGILQAMID